MTGPNNTQSEEAAKQVLVVGSDPKAAIPAIIDNPNAKFVAVEEEKPKPPAIPPSLRKIYRNHSPGDLFHASDGTQYILDDNHSLRRKNPKVKGKKKHRRKMR